MRSRRRSLCWWLRRERYGDFLRYVVLTYPACPAQPTRSPSPAPYVFPPSSLPLTPYPRSSANPIPTHSSHGSSPSSSNPPASSRNSSSSAKQPSPPSSTPSTSPPSAPTASSTSSTGSSAPSATRTSTSSASSSASCRRRCILTLRGCTGQGRG